MDMETWQVADVGYRRAARATQVSEETELEAMLEAMQTGVAEKLGFATFFDYAESVLERSPREVLERVNVGNAIARLPGLRRALASKQLVFCAVRELSRVCIPETEEAWMTAASGL